MSDNLNLRVFEKTDLDFLHRLYNNPEIMAYWFEDPFYSKSALETSFEKNLNNPRIKSFILQNNDETVGLIQLFFIDYIHRKAEFAIIIDPLQQGKGYALNATSLALDYAFRTLNLNKLYLYVDAINEKAIHIYNKAGFIKEATLKVEFFVNGVYHDVVYMCCFEQDYLRMNQ